MPSGSHSSPEVAKTKSGRTRARPNIDDPRSVTSCAAQTSFAFDRPKQPDGTLTRQGDAQSNPRHCAKTHTKVNGLGFRSRIGMDATPALGTVRDYDDLVAVIRARMIELDVTLATVDHVAGLPTNYASKLLGPKRSKAFGRSWHSAHSSARSASSLSLSRTRKRSPAFVIAWSNDASACLSLVRRSAQTFRLSSRYSGHRHATRTTGHR